MSEIRTKGEVFRLLRIAQDMSISQLSERTHISKSFISEIEKGIKEPSEKTIESYCNGLNISKKQLNYMLNNFGNKKYTYQKVLFEILKKIADL